MLDADPHIALLHDDQVPAGLLDEFCSSVNVDSIRFEKSARPEAGPHAGIDWLVLPAIAVFLLKPYFESFMGEAGKDHYHALKKALKALWKKLFSKERRFRAAIVTASGVKKLEYSMLFAIYAALDDGKLVKLLIRENCSEDEYSASVEAFMNFLESHHSCNSDDENSINLNFEAGGGNIILVAYDGKSKTLTRIYLRSDPKVGKN